MILFDVFCQLSFRGETDINTITTGKPWDAMFAVYMVSQGGRSIKSSIASYRGLWIDMRAGIFRKTQMLRADMTL